MEKGQGKGTDTLQTDNVFTRKEYIEREAAIAETRKPRLTDAELRRRLANIPAADVVARDCYDKILAENDDMRAIIDTYGGIENIQSAFVKLHEIETADVVPVVHGAFIPSYNGIVNGEPTYEGYECSECYKLFDENEIASYHFCPNCGALMDKDGDEE